jgi:hypothetical protein
MAISALVRMAIPVVFCPKASDPPVKLLPEVNVEDVPTNSYLHAIMPHRIRS